MIRLYSPANDYFIQPLGFAAIHYFFIWISLSMPTLTHHHLKELGTLLGHTNFDAGICHGFSCMWVQAVFANDEITFIQRLRLISEYNTNLPALKLLISETKEKVKLRQTLDAMEQQYLDILPFYDGVKSYLDPVNAPMFYRNHSINSNKIPEIFEFIKPSVLLNTKLYSLFSKICVLNLKTLSHYLKNLSMIIQATQLDLPMLISSMNHTVCMKFNKDDGFWSYFDVNYLKPFPLDLNAYRHKLNNEQLTIQLFDSFNTLLLKRILFQIRVLSNVDAPLLKQKLQSLNSLFLYEDQQFHHDTNHFYLLHCVCQSEELRFAKKLLANRNHIKHCADYGYTPLHVACMWGSLKLSKLLFKHGASIGARLKSGKSAIIIASLFNRLPIIHWLIRKGANVNDQDSRGLTPLIAACRNGYLEVVIKLLDNQADIHLPDFNDTTPLLTACFHGKIEIVNHLLELKPDLIQSGESLNRPILISACKSLHYRTTGEIFHLLLAHGADLTCKHYHQTALDFALKTNHDTAIPIFLNAAMKQNLDPEKIMSINSIEAAKTWAISQKQYHFLSYLTPILLPQKPSSRPLERPSRPTSLFKAAAPTQIDLPPSKLMHSSF